MGERKPCKSHRSCRGTHPTICEQEGCSIELAQRYTAHLERRNKTIELAKSLGLTDEDLKVMGVKL